jgi:hypothetical protein
MTYISKMSSLPKVKGPRQGDYAVTYYALGREPTPEGLHGYFINVGNFETQKDAMRAAEDARLKLKHIGGVVRVHETGIFEPMLSDEARASRPKSLISDDVNSMYSRQQKEEREKVIKQQKEMAERHRQVQEEAEAYENPASLEYYAKKHMSRRMLEEALVAHEHNLRETQKKLAELRAEITEKDAQFPNYSQEWRDFLRTKIPSGTKEPFFLREREDPNAPAIDTHESLRELVEGPADVSTSG